MRPETGTCKLCLKENVKLCESHIIPEFFYIPLYDETHRYRILSTMKKHNPKFYQNGVKERLLCEDCEKLLNEKYEKYGLSAVKSMQFKYLEPKFKKAVGLDYKKFKLFLLSILWRASVSKHVAFKNVSLGPHEEKIRKMVFSSEIDSSHNYPIFFFEITDENGKRFELIESPEVKKENFNRIYRFSFGGFAWFFVVGLEKLEKEKESIYLKEDGTAVVWQFDFFDGSNLKNSFLKIFGKELKEMGRI